MSISLSSPLHPRDFAARLKRCIFDSFRLKWYTVNIFWSKPVAGEVWTWPDNTIRFFIFKRRFILNFLAPQLEGKISAAETGSIIVAKVSIQHIFWNIIAFPVYALFVVLVALYMRGEQLIFQNLLRESWFYLLVLFGIVLLIIDGALELRYLKKFISDFVGESSRDVFADQ